ncbi:2-aminoethylphosphonate--pyruvate transaminase [Lacticaseibacillus yichunensis]|uniref:2-aminoethylphosphonate--pyruvate transaminase n=1 Tax=Lacticaseibacillus yichunensis TaxID=2486015 RepID=A0ABW4CQL4_9LACO|nr:2-aminoethylphosphonate--pyruvate transaminase [Lacticaseibacillus yichunensis]
MTPYLLLTPGPLTTTAAVKNAMMRDVSTWDVDYNAIVEQFRKDLLEVAQVDATRYAAVLLQGSGSYAVEATIGTALPADGCLMIAVNGAYGRRMCEMCDILGIKYVAITFDETTPVNLATCEQALMAHPEVTHFAVVHCETTTGILNPIQTLIPAMHRRGLITIVDAMSSFVGIPIHTDALHIDYLISSANKCLQGVPGFAFVITRRRVIEATSGNARSLSLDLFDQLQTMDAHHGKWRFTSPTHVVLAAAEAMRELQDEGGVAARNQRYRDNQRRLTEGMQQLGFNLIIAAQDQSPIITSFEYPTANFDFAEFYDQLKARGFVIYPGKVARIPSFRIGNIGAVYPADIDRLLESIAQVMAALA